MIKFNFPVLMLIAIFSHSSFAGEVRIQAASVPAAHGMYVHENGDVWLADTFEQLGAPSAVYDLGGAQVPLTTIGAGIAGIAKHPLADLFSFCDTMGSKISWIDSAGNEFARISVAHPWNARWSPSGRSMFAVTHSGTVVQIQNVGTQSKVLENLDAPFDIAPIDDNSFWLSEQGAAGDGRVCLFKKSASGDFLKQACNKNYKLQNPEGLWPLKDGGVAVVDTEAGTLVKISIDGSTTEIARSLGIPILLQVLDGGRWAVFTNQSNLGPAMIFGESSEFR